VYKAAKAKHPQRWSGTTRNWQPVQVVHLNPEQCVDDQKDGCQQLKKTA
jgi:putative transposase